MFHISIYACIHVPRLSDATQNKLKDEQSRSRIKKIAEPIEINNSRSKASGRKNQVRYLKFCILAEPLFELLVILHHSCLSIEEDDISEFTTISFDLISTSGKFDPTGTAITKSVKTHFLIKWNQRDYAVIDKILLDHSW